MKIIFHGDDFGLTSGINRGIILSFKHGLLSSASIIACGEASGEAISFAGQNPGLDIGIHLTLCDETPVLAPEKLASIISNGSSFPSRGKIVRAILSGRIDYGQVEAEWSAQTEKCLGAGILISHLDSHQFVHLFPGLFPVCLKIAAKYKIPYIRTSIFDPACLEPGFKRLFQLVSLKSWIKFFVTGRVPGNVKTHITTGFLHAGGRLDAKTILKGMDRLTRMQRHSCVEVMLHPGTGDGRTLQKYRDWDYNWKKDLDLLLDPHLKKELKRRRIAVTSFRE